MGRHVPFWVGLSARARARGHRVCYRDIYSRFRSTVSRYASANPVLRGISNQEHIVESQVLRKDGARWLIEELGLPYCDRKFPSERSAFPLIHSRDIDRVASQTQNLIVRQELWRQEGRDRGKGGGKKGRNKKDGQMVAANRRVLIEVVWARER